MKSINLYFVSKDENLAILKAKKIEEIFNMNIKNNINVVKLPTVSKLKILMADICTISLYSFSKLQFLYIDHSHEVHSAFVVNKLK